MILKLIRDVHDCNYTGGRLYLDGDFFCWTLEPAPPVVPLGIYQVDMTTSARAQRGELWTPAPDGRLPLLARVPGHEGIRIHAGNFAKDTQGCILVGDRRAEGAVYQSRTALTRLIGVLVTSSQLEITDEVVDE